MRTPNAPPDATAQAATLKLHRPPGDDSDLADRPDVRTTPVPVGPDGAFPRVRGYEILSVVGYGGMAVVYEARHKELNRRVAIKMLRGGALADPDYRERFRAEAEAIARLQHPNIIQVFEVGTVEAQPGELYPIPFLALEFVDGGSLTQHTYSPHPPRGAAKTVETLARAAHAAHLLGVIHRDLKPANVLLTRDGVPKVADFGIAKRIDAECDAASRSLTRDGTVLGTPEYMAPEQLRGTVATPTIDVYSLGVILYELLTARVPFQGATFADTMLLSVRQEPVPPRRLQPGVPRDLETICLKCLEKAPGKRYESAEELADDLARWADGRAIRARAVGPLGRGARWAGRNPTVALLSVAVLLVGLAGVSGIGWNWNEARTNEARALNNATRAETNATRAETNSTRAEAEARNAREAAAKERWERYRVSVFAASGALRLHDINAARQALGDAPPEHRDWVWRLLHAQLDKSQHVLPLLGDARGVVFSADGRRAVAMCPDRSLRICDLIARTERLLVGPEARAESYALSDDGAVVAYGTAAGPIVVCDAPTGRVRVTLRGHTRAVSPLVFSRDGKRLYSCSLDCTARVWELATGEAVTVFRAEGALSLVICPEGRTVAVRPPGDLLSLWDLATGRRVAALPPLERPLLIMRFSPKGDRFVAAEGFPTNTLRVWDSATGRPVAVLRGHENQLNQLEFSPDGTRLVSAAMDRTVRVWDAGAGTAPVERGPLLTMEGHTGWVQHATFSPDGSRIVSSSYDRTLRYWDARTGKLLGVLPGHTMDVLVARYLDGGWIASGSTDGTLRLWDMRALERGAAVRGHRKFVYSVAFHPDGNRVASAAWDGTARVWDANTGRQLLALDHPAPHIVSSVAFRPDGRTLATLARDGARVWSADTGALLRHWPLDSADYRDGRLAFGPDGKLLAAGAPDGLVHVWDVDTGAEVAALKGHKTQIRDVAFSPDGKWLASAGEAGDSTVRIWSLETKQQVRVLTGHDRAVYALGVNRAGTLLASGGTDGTVRVWDTATWLEVGPHLKIGANVYAVEFASDGKLLALGCADNLIRICDVATRQEVAALREHSDYVHSLAFSPDGSRLVSGSGDATLRVWDALPPKERFGR